MSKVKYAVKGISAADPIPTGPFETYDQAKDYLMRNTPSDHLKAYFGNNKQRWCDFMIYELKGGD